MAARTLIVTTQAIRNGATIDSTTGDVAGMKFSPAERAYLSVYNADAVSAHTLTLVLPPPPDIADATDRTVSIPALSTKLIGPFPGDMYTQPSAADPADVGFIHFNVDSTQLFIVAVRL